ncbi:MAG: TrpR YerC/YecD [Firmicutes bacterium]|nr:TrpR YerC/YecD [Bacillota bacterium]MBQ9605331.1 TrpR YerC/YecD [Bacillota bacterium]
MSDKLKSNAADRLFDGIMQLKTREECYAFFEDICTIHEIQSLAQRFEVAGMLQKGITYSEIAAKTGASTATISRVNRSLNYGEGGYKTVIERLGEEK